MSIPVRLIESIIDMPAKFAPAVTQDPISAILVALGGLFVFAASAVFGVLTLGAAIDLILPDSEGTTHRPG